MKKRRHPVTAPAVGPAPEKTERGISPETSHRAWSVQPIFAWFDLWVGVYIDRKGRRIYVLPLPCLGFVVGWP